MAAISLIFCALVAQEAPADPPKTTVDLLVDRGSIDRAPGVVPLPKNLPDPRRAPDDGIWKDKGSLPTPAWAGAFLPRPLDLHVAARLRLLEQYPAKVCQPRIDSQKLLCGDRLDRQAATLESQCVSAAIDRAIETPEDPGVPFWQAALAVSLTVVVAGAGGYGTKVLVDKIRGR